MREISSEERLHRTRRLTLWGLAVNFLLSIVKAIAGLLAQSGALVADAIHSLSDCITDVVVLVGAAFWNAPPDAEHPHGHGRIETAASLGIGLSLAVVGCFFVRDAILSITTPQPIPGWAAFFVALLSIGTKEGLYRWTISEGRKLQSQALLANAWHHRSDGLSSIPVALSVIATQILPQLTFLDALATFLVALFILKAAFDLSWPALGALLDRGACAETCKRIEALALETEGVCSIHALRSRSIGSGYQVDLHVMVEGDLTVREGHRIAKAVKQRILQQEPDILEVLVHLEPKDDETSGPKPIDPCL